MVGQGGPGAREQPKPGARVVGTAEMGARGSELDEDWCHRRRKFARRRAPGRSSRPPISAASNRSALVAPRSAPLRTLSAHFGATSQATPCVVRRTSGPSQAPPLDPSSPKAGASSPPIGRASASFQLGVGFHWSRPEIWLFGVNLGKATP